MLQLRYLQTLNSISSENNSTIVFPVPMDIVSHFLGRKVGICNTGNPSITYLFNCRRIRNGLQLRTRK